MTNANEVNTNEKSILKQLKSIGIPRALYYSILPSWWNSELYNEPMAALELGLILKKRLGLVVSIDDDGFINVKNSDVIVEFKSKANIDQNTYTAATCIADGIAETFSGEGFRSNVNEHTYTRVNELLIEYKPSSLEGLLGFMGKELGIPVVPLVKLPSGMNKPAAMVVKKHGFYTIFICHKINSFGSLIFMLLHELAHIGLGHLESDSDGVLTDVEFSQLESVDDKRDNQEVDADSLALDVLRGGNDIADFLSSVPEDPSSAQLASLSRKFGQSLDILPSHLILSYGKEVGNWPLVWKAMRFIEKGKAQDVLVENYKTLLAERDFSMEEYNFLTGSVL